MLWTPTELAAGLIKMHYEIA